MVRAQSCRRQPQLRQKGVGTPRSRRRQGRVPTSAGSSPLLVTSTFGGVGVPLCGDDTIGNAVPPVLGESSPHTRGWSRHHRLMWMSVNVDAAMMVRASRSAAALRFGCGGRHVGRASCSCSGRVADFAAQGSLCWAGCRDGAGPVDGDERHRFRPSGVPAAVAAKRRVSAFCPRRSGQRDGVGVAATKEQQPERR